MKKNFKLKSFGSVVLCVISTFFATSCTSDDFFGLNEEYEGVSYSMMDKIAHSKEYIDYQKKVFKGMTELSKIDRTQMEIVDSLDGKYIYATNTNSLLESAFVARQKLAEMYPEFENTTDVEKNYILNIAVNTNRSLRILAEQCNNGNSYRTKSANYESDAVRWVRSASSNELISDSNGCTDLVTGANSMWSVNGLTMYAYNNCFNACYDAASLSIRYHTEYGGFSWEDTDGSGILIQDPFATIRNMHFTNISGVPNPSWDFHIHPSGNLQFSEADYETWSRMNWSEHYIFDQEGNSRVYWF